MGYDLVRYIKKNLKKGYTPDTLKYALISQGYSRTIVERALVNAQKEISKEIPEIKEKPKIRYEIYDKDNKPIKIIENYKLGFFEKIAKKLKNIIGK